MRQALVGASVRPVPHARRGPMVIAKPADAISTSLPAPVGGWDAISSLANMKPERAIVLDNWFPRPDSIEVRNGIQVHCGGMSSSVVDSIMVYEGLTSGASKMFCATGGSLYDVTSAGSPSVTTQTGLQSNRWQWVDFSTSAGKFLWICNGIDAPRHWNGTTWAQPTITGISATDIINVNAHKNRLWFVLNQSTQAAFLSTGAIAGAATTFEFGGLFTRGGYLVAMATWTRDGGSGPDDFAVFISSRGQVVIYAGDDPAQAETWSLIGVFNLGAPIGRRCFTKVGGDVVLINIDGVLPLSLALSQDRGATTNIALTKNIQNVMNTAARSYASQFGWQLQPYPKGTMALMNVPLMEGSQQHQYVMNTLTGAWCRFTGWNINCMAVFQDRLFLGGNSGQVYEGDLGAYDLGSQIVATGQTAYSYYGARGRLKNFGLARALVTTDSDSRIALGMSSDFINNATLGTPASAESVSARYDSAIYDTDVYASADQSVSDWVSIAQQGHSGAVHFRGITGAGSGISIWGTAQWGSSVWSNPVSGDVVLRINGFDVIYRLGGMM